MMILRPDAAPLNALRTCLPKGRPLRPAAFALRHRGVLVLLWLHVPALAVVATAARGQQVRSVAAALGLVTASSVLVHLWEGAIEGHFHFFVVMTVLALYQSWLPFMVALGFIVLEHGIFGALASSSVYNHQAASNDPWTWALIHGGFVLASCAGNLLAWRLTEEEALHDGLTGLANRVLLLDVLSARLRRGDRRTAVVFLDLDGFKDANDGFGHEVGDDLLVAVTRRLSPRLRSGDLLARLGGDEFAVVLTADSAEAARVAADRLLTSFAEPFGVGELSLVASASAGVSIASADSTAASLLREADLAMYSAKRAGGGRSAVFEPALHLAAAGRSAVISELPAALRDDQFVVHYQPVFSLTDDSTVGVEALVRWEHPQRGRVAPNEFIPAAEQSGFIVELGTHVLRTACRQAAAWRDAFPDQPDLVMSVNLSPRQLAEPDLVSTVVAVLAETGLSPSSLCLEVTEGAVIRDLDDTLPRLRALSAIGVRLALDDFGTGYSSLAYLQRMPVDVLKVDRSFVAALGHDSPDTAIVAAVVQLAHQLGLSVTAEGIETSEQLQVLQGLDCETGQGFLRARPAPAADITAHLDAERRARRVPRPRTAQAQHTATAGNAL